MFDGRFRGGIERSMRPVGASLRKAGISADVLTATGLVMAVAASVTIALGHLELGFLLVFLTGVPDLLDGAVAKASGTAGPRGAFFDSVSDRVTDALLLGGVAWYLAGEYGGRMAVLPLAVLAAASIISYERAKAEALGFDARGGLMERAERVMLLALGLLFEALLVPVLVIMLVLSLVTVVQRFVKVWRQASAPPLRPPRRSWRSRRTARSSRVGSRSGRHVAGPVDRRGRAR